MTAKKLMMLVPAMALILAIPAALFANSGDGEAKAKPPTKIEAEFEFNITGHDLLTITGTAEGLSPGKTYHSAIYGFDSFVEGVNSCKPADPVGGSMFAGNWIPPVDGGKWTLLHVTDADLDKIFTISVRTGPPVPGPSNIVLVCGEVEVDDDDDDDGDDDDDD